MTRRLWRYTRLSRGGHTWIPPPSRPRDRARPQLEGGRAMMDKEALETLKQINNTRWRSLHAHTADCGRCRDEVMAFLLSPTRCPGRERTSARGSTPPPRRRGHEQRD